MGTDQSRTVLDARVGHSTVVSPMSNFEVRAIDHTCSRAKAAFELTSCVQRAKRIVHLVSRVNLLSADVQPGPSTWQECAYAQQWRQPFARTRAALRSARDL